MQENIKTEVLPSVMTTAEAARHLNRQPQTLRRWACLQEGPIQPIRINGRLAWRLDDLQRLLNGNGEAAV
ncbi:helix-turn-helix domain-containing protein [Burkholderia ambifaria]|uniref:helix-turn-helix domain-containing protein n=1 Tax=Burkholderia ambifaria TaxID=152480 RepID=UPI00158B0288|nr:helix-turn-helix domain-containing protein [Burkholderia ambifaria]